MSASLLRDELVAATESLRLLRVNSPKTVEFMDLHFAGLAYTIIDPTLTSGNCHGLTFGAGGETDIPFRSIDSLLELLGWDAEEDWVESKSRPILVCFQGDEIGHTATKDGAGWKQTLPGGPLFSSSRAALESTYSTCLDLSIEGERAELKRMWGAKQGGLEDLLAEVRALLGKPPGDNEDLAYYQERWSSELAKDPDQDESTLENWRDQLKDMRA
jgi:hypothetical protein